jgi:uncharacterized protein YbjT (DUF2867 family)
MLVVAGATGHVGSVVADTLLAKKQKVRVIARDAKKAEALARRGAEVALGALDDQAFLSTALRGATGFFALVPPNLAAPDVFAYQRQTADAIAAAVAACKVPHVVLLSSIGADLDAGNGPIKGLHYAEEALRKVTKLTALRAGSFQENAGNAIGPARAQGLYFNFQPSADLAMPMIATRDIGVAAADALLSPPKGAEVVDVIGPASSHREIAEKLGAALGKKLQIIDIPQAGWLEAMLKGGLPRPWAEAFNEMYAGFASGRLQPKGTRQVHGKTPIDEVIKALVRAG